MNERINLTIFPVRFTRSRTHFGTNKTSYSYSPVKEQNRTKFLSKLILHTSLGTNKTFYIRMTGLFYVHLHTSLSTNKIYSKTEPNKKQYFTCTNIRHWARMKYIQMTEPNKTMFYVLLHTSLGTNKISSTWGV